MVRIIINILTGIFVIVAPIILTLLINSLPEVVVITIGIILITPIILVILYAIGEVINNSF